MKNIAILILSLSFLFPMFPANSAAADKDANPVLRICIIDDKESIDLRLRRGYKIYAGDSERVLLEGVSLDVRAEVVKDGLRIGSRIIKASGVRIRVITDGNIYVDERRFRGDIGITRKENTKLMVINYVPLEEYLYGVLYHEVSHRWPVEALKAQAIAARTFAMYQARQNKIQPYDLRNDIYSQVYGGSTSEKWATTRAVDLTKGKVLAYNGDIFPTYYHAACAGYTEDAANLWNSDIPPLKGIECVYCKNSPHYKWTKEILLWELKNKLKSNGYNVENINSVNILSRNKSGRVDKMEIKNSRGTSVMLTAKDFRQMMGPNNIRSTKFTTAIKWGALIVDGFGWGHGVGMCQWGVYGMSLKGKTAEEMLKYYYPEAEMVTIDKLADKL